MASGGPPMPPSSGPSVSISVPEDEEAAENSFLPPSPVRSSLGVPQQIKSSIGVNNPLNKGGLNKLPVQGGLFPLPNSQQVAGGSATGNPRNKVALAKGFSMMDWIRLTKSGKDLTGVGGPIVKGKIREVSKKELAKHRKRKDAWMAINGAVYNVTPYMDFHPGGWDELVKGAGRDATDLFNEIHRWVNYQGLLEACLVGKLVDKVETEVVSPSPPKPVLPPIPSKPPTPTLDFFQTNDGVTVNIYTKRKFLTKHQITIDNSQDTLKVLVLLPDSKEGFLVHLHLFSKVDLETKFKVGSSGNVEINLRKAMPLRWPNLGEGLDRHLWCGPITQLGVQYRSWVVAKIELLTKDIKLILLRPPPSTLMYIPPGHHVHIRSMVEGIQIVRSYTPVQSLDISRLEDEGCIQLMIKIYSNGALTPILGDLKEGEEVEVSDHTGSFSLSGLEGRSGFLLLAAGTGITPMLSVLPFIPTSTTITLMFFNKTEQDIPWKTELDNLSNVKVIHVMSNQEEFQGPKGRISKELLATSIDSLGGEPLVLVCGPPAFTRTADVILKQGYGIEEDNIHLFQG